MFHVLLGFYVLNFKSSPDNSILKDKNLCFPSNYCEGSYNKSNYKSIPHVDTRPVNVKYYQYEWNMNGLEKQ